MSSATGQTPSISSTDTTSPATAPLSDRHHHPRHPNFYIPEIHYQQRELRQQLSQLTDKERTGQRLTDASVAVFERTEKLIRETESIPTRIQNARAQLTATIVITVMGVALLGVLALTLAAVAGATNRWWLALLAPIGVALAGGLWVQRRLTSASHRDRRWTSFAIPIVVAATGLMMFGLISAWWLLGVVPATLLIALGQVASADTTDAVVGELGEGN